MTIECKICTKEFTFTPLESIMGISLGDFKPSICSEACFSRFKAQEQRDISKNAFYEILNKVPDVYKGVRMSDFEKSTYIREINKREVVGAKSILEEFCNGGFWCLSLFSPNFGNGKTRLAIYALACLALKGFYRSVHPYDIQEAGYYSAIDIGKILRTESFDSRQFNLKRFYNARVLVIDDLGQETEAMSVEIAGILKVREENKRKTIITSNLSRDLLEVKYSGRIYSRIAQGVFLVKGSDRRLK